MQWYVPRMTSLLAALASFIAFYSTILLVTIVLCRTGLLTAGLCSAFDRADRIIQRVAQRRSGRYPTPLLPLFILVAGYTIAILLLFALVSRRVWLRRGMHDNDPSSSRLARWHSEEVQLVDSRAATEPPREQDDRQAH